MDGWSVNKGAGVRGRAQRLPGNANQVSTALGKHRVVWFWLLVCWCVGWFSLLGLLVAWIWRKHEKTHTVMDGSWTGTKM